MKLHLPHQCSLDVLPSPTKKWSATTHPTKSWAFGYLGHHIFYKHFYFHQGCVLHMKAFAPSTTATTIGNGSNPRGSTKLDEVTGHNCDMSQDNYLVFTIFVLGLWLEKTLGTKQSDSLFVNMLLEDFVSLSNLTAVFTLNAPAD
jgi:hypothetical protein